MENAQLIEQFAKSLNEEALQVFEWVDYYADCFPTVAAKLAYEQQHDAVELLIKCNANIGCIAYAYALSGNDEKVEQYRQLASRRSLNINEDILLGYAAAGNHEQASLYNVLTGNSFCLVVGYALAGLHELVEEHKIATKECLNDIAQAYALAGFHDKVEQYRQHPEVSSNVIAWGYAKAGNHAEVRKYVDSYGADINCIAHGYAYSGNHKWVRVYQAKGASLSAIALGYAHVNNRKKVAEYFALGAEMDVIIRYCITIGQDDLVRDFLAQFMPNLLTIAECYKESGQEDKALEYELLHKKDELSLIEYYYKRGVLSRMKECIISYLQPKQTMICSYLASLLFQPLIPHREHALISAFVRQFDFIDSIEHVEVWIEIWKKQEGIQDWADLPVCIQKILTRCEIPFDMGNDLSL